jgi:outer membrane protein assembly factor BamE (lipoprotein component of BamABCDE complex)
MHSNIRPTLGLDQRQVITVANATNTSRFSDKSASLALRQSTPRHIRHFLIMAALSALLPACAHLDSGSGVEFRYDRLKELRSGMTIAQVEELLGKPLSIEKVQQETIYGYTFGNVKAFKMVLVSSQRTYENATARLVFKDQVLQSFTYEITEPKK